MSEVREELLNKNPWSLMIKLSLPAILGQFVVGLYAFVDSIYVGQMVGTDAMSAVSAASPFVLINNGIAVLLGIGSGSILSRAIGAKDWQTVDKIMGNLSVLVLLMSACVMAIGIPLAPVFLRLFSFCCPLSVRKRLPSLRLCRNCCKPPLPCGTFCAKVRSLKFTPSALKKSSPEKLLPSV